MKRIIIAVLALAAMFTACADTAADRSAAKENGSNAYESENVTQTVGEETTASAAENAEQLPEPAETTAAEAGSQTISEENDMKITINGTEYTAHFSDTKAAEELKAILPLTLDMSELNGNEKYIYLDKSFTASSENVGYINKGDIMLYGSDCLVLFYDSFSTPYSYTRLGAVDDPAELENAVGSGSVTITFAN